MSVKDLLVTSAEDNIIPKHAFIEGPLIKNMQHLLHLVFHVFLGIMYRMYIKLMYRFEIKIIKKVPQKEWKKQKKKRQGIRRKRIMEEKEKGREIKVKKEGGERK